MSHLSRPTLLLTSALLLATTTGSCMAQESAPTRHPAGLAKSQASAAATAFAAPDSTLAGISGTITTVVAGATYSITLPDIIITENFAGAIRASALIAIGADYQAFTAFDSGAASIKAYRLDNGNDVSASIVGSNTLSTDPMPSATNIADAVFQLAAPSNSSTGPVKLVIHGLKGSLGGPEEGDISIKIGGAASGGNQLDSLNKIDSGQGAGVTAQPLKIAFAGCPAYPSVPGAANHFTGCAAFPPPDEGPLTSRTITLPAKQIPANYQGRRGSIFVLAIFRGNVAIMDSQQQWSLFTSCTTAPPFLTEQLQQLPITPVIKTPSDLSDLVGAMVVRGFGLAAIGTPTDTACLDMLQNATYNVEYMIR